MLPWLKANAGRFDAVIVEGIWQYHSYAAWRALAGTSTPYFVFTHGMLDPWFKKRYPLKHFKKWMYWPWADYRVLRDARAVIFTSAEERLLARESFWLYRAKEETVSLGTDEPPPNSWNLAERFIDSWPETSAKRIILFLGRIHETKGLHLLMHAFEKIHEEDERLHIVVAGPDQTGLLSLLKESAEDLGITKHVTWTGMLKGDLKWGAYYASEVFCLPSHHENFGIVVSEALSCGKPALLSNKVNIWREIEQNNAGFVDDDTVEGVVRNLRRWLAMDEDNYARMCQSARKCFTSRFHISATAQRFAEIVRRYV